MKAIILAAGRGSRMKALTDDKPKCLVELNGKPLLEWQLEALRDAGIDEIAILTGYKKELLHSYGLKEFHNPFWAKTQMVSSLMCAEDWLRNNDCIVSYSDIFYESSAISILKECNAEICITYDPNWEDLWRKRFSNPLDDAETFRLNSDGSLAEIGCKPESLDEVQGQYMGLLKFSSRGWPLFADIFYALNSNERDQVHMTSMLQLVVNSGSVSIVAEKYQGRWAEFDSITDLDAVRD